MQSHNNNKRKQQQQDWNDMNIYSTEAPPLQAFNMDHFFDENSSLNRRHSVAVGELDNMNHYYYHQSQQPFAWPHASASAMDHRSSISTASPSTPGFFSPSFLDTLKHENEYISDDVFQEMMLQPTITPSAINKHQTDNLTNWLLNQPATKRRKPSPTTILSTPSPPYPSTILEEEDDDEQSHNQDHIVASRIIQGEHNVSIIKPLIEKYITSHYENERKVMIFTSKVAQKSYGTEKRFLCPPPTTVLSGASWFIPSSSSINRPPHLSVHIEGEKSSQNGIIEWKKNNSSAIDFNLSLNETNDMVGTCVSKQLHISDADEKRKNVQVFVKVTLGNGNLLGTIPSKSIKVISKPSKKRQSLKNLELCIHHGTTVALFNRVRSQTISTKYLGVATGDNICFEARTTTWDPFLIWIVDINQSSETAQRPNNHPHHYPPPPAIALQATTTTAVHYNQPIVLQCVRTGLVSPVMVIRKVDRGSMVVGGNRVDSQQSFPSGGECGDEALGDPVSQLHKVAFQIVQDPAMKHPHTTDEWILPYMQQPSPTYLACLENMVGTQKAVTERQMTMSRPLIDQQDPRRNKRRVSYDATVHDRHPYRRRVNSFNDELFLKGDCGTCWTEDATDASIWTIVGTECASYKFWIPPAIADLNAPFSSARLITPIPTMTQQSSNRLHYNPQQKVLYLNGEHFSKDLTVWFGDVRAVTTDIKSRTSLSCQIPDVAQILASPTCSIDMTTNQHQVPILLVRGDGIVYNTDLFFTL